MYYKKRQTKMMDLLSNSVTQHDNKKSSPQEGNDTTEQEIKISINDEIKNSTNEEKQHSRDNGFDINNNQEVNISRDAVNDMSVTTTKAICNSKKSRNQEKNNKQEKKTIHNQDVNKSRVVSSNGIVRKPENITLRVDFYQAIRILAIKKGVKAWYLIDEALGQYLEKNGVIHKE